MSLTTINELASKVEEIVDQSIRKGELFDSYQTIDLIKQYSGDDWKDSVKFDQLEYNRVQLYCGEQFDIWLICWDIGQKSNIHDHPENGCVQKVLQGKLIEKRYIRKDDIGGGKREKHELCRIWNKVYEEGDVTYISGEKGIHMLKNIGDIGAVTLHLYSPPNYIPKIINV